MDALKKTMKAIVVTDPEKDTSGMSLTERPMAVADLNDVIVQVYTSGFTSGELTWPSTWADRTGKDRTPTIPAMNWQVSSWNWVMVQQGFR